MGAAKSSGGRPRRGLPITFGVVLDEQTGLGRQSLRPGSRPLKTSEVVAVRLVRDIGAAELHVGDRLPDEASMLAQYKVSRDSLREALRILEVQGFITIHRGPGGGPKVAAVDPAFLARTATLYFHLSGATYDEMFETWFLVEPAVAEKVAALPDRPRLRRSLEPFTIDLPPDVKSDVVFSVATGFHAELARLSGNRVLGLLVQAIGHIVVDHVMLDLDPVQERTTLERDHRRIAEAIIAGRTHKARTLMSAHIATMTEIYRSRWPDRMGELIQWR